MKFLVVVTPPSIYQIFSGYFRGASHLACLCNLYQNHPPQGKRQSHGRRVTTAQEYGSLVHNQNIPDNFPGGRRIFSLPVPGQALLLDFDIYPATALNGGQIMLIDDLLRY